MNKTLVAYFSASGCRCAYRTLPPASKLRGAFMPRAGRKRQLRLTKARRSRYNMEKERSGRQRAPFRRGIWKQTPKKYPMLPF